MVTRHRCCLFQGNGHTTDSIINTDLEARLPVDMPSSICKWKKLPTTRQFDTDKKKENPPQWLALTCVFSNTSEMLRKLYLGCYRSDQNTLLSTSAS